MAHRIKRIKITGFRRLRELDLTVRPFAAVIGANGVGKTSLLDAFTLLSAAASGDLNRLVSQCGGIGSLLTRGKSEDITLLVEMSVQGGVPLEYELHLSPRGAGYSIAKEILSQRRDRPDPFTHIDSADGNVRYFETECRRLVRPTWEHDPMETSLSQVPKMFREPEEFRRILASADMYHVLDVGPRAPVKMPQTMKPASLPGLNGEDLAPYLYYLREADRNRFDAIIDSLRAAFRDFEEMSFPPVAAGTLAVTWKDRQFNKPFYMHELSEGALRFLWLVSLLHSPDLAAVTMIDEPEVSLHPELLSLLADLMREASRRTQLIVATHSDRFIRFLRPEEVIVMDIGEDGCATAVWADSLDLDQWLSEYGLDEVWRLGRMGGRS